jgi:D-alanyl-lipoteichoic acid acyltransferase DltB (MBOAT superfamily)
MPIVWLIFSLTPDRWRWLVLLVASYSFYATLKAPYLLLVLIMVTATSYACGLRLAAHQDETRRKRWLWGGIAACVGVLSLLKYLPFMDIKAIGIFGLDGAFSKTLISIGVSYYVFQAISYLADIYLKGEAPEKHFGRFALYMAFFPKLLQGPIERSSDLCPQLKKPYEFDYDSVRTGLLLFAWGLFKKVVIADRLNLMVNSVYNDVHSYTGFSLILATYLYALQIYFDFSGYTDMALGSARLFNIKLGRLYS